jgi:thiol-disulfide isomerase/thioredoxin
MISGCKKGVPTPDGDVLGSLTLPLATEDPGVQKTFDPSALRGKPTLVMFASPSCGFCSQELPIAHKLTTAEGVNMAVVYVKTRTQSAINAAKAGGYDGVVLIDDGALSKKYEIQGVPYTLILGADGHAKKAFRGLQDEGTLRDAIADAR